MLRPPRHLAVASLPEGPTVQGPHLALFGQPALRDERGQPVKFRTRKQLALLVYLALEALERPVSREAVIDLLWPDVPPEYARHSLSQGLSAIREQLGTDITTRAEEQLALTRPIPTDLDALRAGVRPPLDFAHPLKDLDGCAGVAFSHWVDGMRQRCLREARQVLLEQLKAARAAGDLPRVHERAALLYNADPLCDAAIQALAERCLLEGDVVAAVRLLRGHLDRVRQELGCEPAPELKRLVRRLEAGERPLPAAQRPVERAAARVRPEIFVGRADELAALEAAWSEAQEQGLRTYLITGQPGIGKSSLVRRFATSVAARAWPALVVTCQEIGHSIPFAAISEFMYALSRDPAVSGTDPAWLAEASRVAPGLRAVYPGIPEPPPAPAESVRLRVAEALVQMLDAVTEGGPVLMVFDNVQHMDPATRAVLHVLLRRLEPKAVLLLGTARGEGYEGVLLGEDRSTALGWQRTAPLGPLSRAHTLELIDELAGARRDGVIEPAVAETIAALAQGNPYLVEMLYTDWRQNPAESLVGAEVSGDGTAAKWQPPDMMRRAFARQYQGLSPDAQHMLHLLAVAGRVVTAEEVSSLLPLTAMQVDGIALELINRGIVRVDGPGFAFKNELHRAFVYYAMPEDGRKYHHRRLARGLLSGDPEAAAAAALEAAHHFRRAGLTEDAIQATMRGAEFALGHGAPNEAERAIAAALPASHEEYAETLRVLLALALSGQGKYQAALNLAAQLRPSKLSSRYVVATARVRAEALHRGRLADDETIKRAASAFLETAQQLGDDADVMRAIQVSAEAASDSSDLTALYRLRSAAASVRDRTAKSDTKALAMLTEGFCLLVAGQADDAAQVFQAAAPLLEHNYWDLRRVLNGLGLALNSAGDHTGSISAFRRAIEIAKRVSDADGTANSWSNLGVVYEDLGLFQAAVEAYRQALQAVGTTSNPRRAAEVHTNVAGLSLILGNVEESHRMAQEGLRFAQESQLWRLSFDALLLMADWYLAQSDVETSFRIFEETDALRADKAHPFANQGRYERLKRHHLWLTQGYEAVQAYAAARRPNVTSMDLADRLEVLVFEEWLANRVEEKLPPRWGHLNELLQRKLYGVLASMITVGVKPEPIPERLPGESSGQLIARLFPDPQRSQIPSAVAS